MPFVEFYMLKPRDLWWTVPDDMIRCHSLFTSSGNDNQLPAVMWLDLHMDIYLSVCHAVTLAKLNSNILDNTYILHLLPLTLRLIIVAEWTMIWYPSGGYWHCMHYAWGISVNCYNYYVYLLRCLPSTTFTNCYTRWFFSVLWWTRYSAALCCPYARRNQSSDAQ